MDINPFISGGISLITGLLGWWLGRRDNFRDRKRLAGAALIEAFAPDRAQLRHYSNNDIVEILESAFIKHQTAVDKFRAFLDERHQIAFDNAWHQYYADPKSGKKLIDQYSEQFDETYTNGNARQTAIERIEALLAFAVNK